VAGPDRRQSNSKTCEKAPRTIRDMTRAIVARTVAVPAAFLVLATGAAEGRETSADAAPGRAKVWFAPLPPLPTDEGRPYFGAPDFMQLFSRKTRWSTAAKRISAFKLYGEWVHRTATDRQLRRVVDDLRRRKIAIALGASGARR